MTLEEIKYKVINNNLTITEQVAQTNGIRHLVVEVKALMLDGHYLIEVFSIEEGLLHCDDLQSYIEILDNKIDALLKRVADRAKQSIKTCKHSFNGNASQSLTNINVYCNNCMVKIDHVDLDISNFAHNSANELNKN